MIRFFKGSIILMLIISGGCQKKDLGQAEISKDYIQDVKNWKQDRVESIKSPTGWLRLAGMFWLEEGKNSFGSGEDQDVQLPEGTIPEEAGTFIYEDAQVIMAVNEGIIITHDGKPVSEMFLFDGENEDTPYVQHENLEWYVIKRGDMIGVRLYNKKNSQADQFTGFESYPIDPEWNRKARFIPNPDGTTISIVNVLGQEEELESPGVLEFSINGEIYTLAAIESDDNMFLIVGDETNQTETYQAGRYIYVDFPEDDNQYTHIDFNKLYNPPCAYSLFTTCQLPPPQNQLEVAIAAGEKRAKNWRGLH